MDWQSTNGANLAHWSDRSTPNSMSQVGMAVELGIAGNALYLQMVYVLLNASKELLP
jgi:hypothetical protein